MPQRSGRADAHAKKNRTTRQGGTRAPKGSFTKVPRPPVACLAVAVAGLIAIEDSNTVSVRHLVRVVLLQEKKPLLSPLKSKLESLTRLLTAEVRDLMRRRRGPMQQDVRLKGMRPAGRDLC